MVKGSCECKSVVFELDGILRPSIACHCSQCRKTSGHYWSVTKIEIEKFNLLMDSGLKWYSSSEEAKRGFCKECGSSLFFKFNNEDMIYVGSGTLDGKTNLKTGMHIFVASKGDYYDISDELPQYEEWN
jgi:hypothetical protein